MPDWCDAVNPDTGDRCEKPHGHTGPHGLHAFDGQYFKTWYDEIEADLPAVEIDAPTRRESPIDIDVEAAADAYDRPERLTIDDQGRTMTEGDAHALDEARAGIRGFHR